jgi:hypothetical protein
MSLINDALKRAKEAQQKTEAVAPGPPLRPAEPFPPAARRIGIVLPLVVVLFVFFSWLLVLQMRQKVLASQPKVENKPSARVSPAPKAPVQTTTASTPRPPVTVTAAAIPPVAAVTVPDPQPKLQAIFFAPGHSTAIISGKTVRSGNSIKGFRVAAINQSSVTLVSATQTNLMTLETVNP